MYENKILGKIAPGTVLLLVIIAIISGVTEAETKTYTIEPESYEFCKLDADEGLKIEYEFNVKDEDGPNINVYLLNQTNYENLVNGKRYDKIPGGGENDVRFKTVSYEVEETGNYYIVMHNIHNQTVNTELNGEVIDTNDGKLFGSKPAIFVYGFFAFPLLIYVFIPGLETILG